MLKTDKKTLVVIIISCALDAVSQTAVQLSPVLISSGGGRSGTADLSLYYSIGEPVIETKGPVSGLILTQGFQQPFNDSVSIINDADTAPKLVFYTAFSPFDTPGKNDTWIIDNIESSSYRNNTVTIFNRWGNKVWRGKGYNNTTVVWDGTDTNKKNLPVGTYFYVITKDGKSESVKGWVEITKK